MKIFAEMFVQLVEWVQWLVPALLFSALMLLPFVLWVAWMRRYRWQAPSRTAPPAAAPAPEPPAAPPPEPAPPAPDLPSYEDVVLAFGTQKRIADDYFRVIESMEKQRDQYKLMWLEQGRNHAAGQELYERELGRARQVALRALALINEAVEKTGGTPLKHPFELMTAPMGTVEQYKKAIEAHIRACPPEIDGIEARRQIALSAAAAAVPAPPEPTKEPPSP